MCWRHRLREEWSSAQDDATKEFLLEIYSGKIAALSEEECESLLEELNQL
jgi:hypothetical protein